MTNKLFYQSSYIREWKTKIIHTFERENEKYVILEESAFYPHGGGQPCDTGRIGKAVVLDVFSEGDQILHHVDVFPEHVEVECEIDWDKRFDHMQQHSGQHLLSAVCRNVIDAPTVSFHLGAAEVTIDVVKTEITEHELQQIEEAVNHEIYKNHTITSYFITSEELNTLPVVKKPKVTDNIRIVEIKGIEYNACGGTHVASTGELGLIKLYKTEKHKSGTRIYFKCGGRAMADYRKNLQLLNTISAAFNTSYDQIMSRLENRERIIKYQEDQLLTLKKENDAYLAKELVGKNDSNLVAHVFEEKSAKDMQLLAGKLIEEHDIIVLLASKAENKIVLSRAVGQELACGHFFKKELSRFNGRGGGNEHSSQAGFSSHTDMMEFFMFAQKELTSLV